MERIPSIALVGAILENNNELAGSGINQQYY
jgi:hypothetical protein